MAEEAQDALEKNRAKRKNPVAAMDITMSRRLGCTNLMGYIYIYIYIYSYIYTYIYIHIYIYIYI